MKQIFIKSQNCKDIEIELDEKKCPRTVKLILENLPFTVQSNLWGDEIYTSETPIKTALENAKSVVELNDVAYWPTGKAICLFYGPTPIGNPGEITPYSPVSVIGKIKNSDKQVLKQIGNGTELKFTT